MDHKQLAEQLIALAEELLKEGSSVGSTTWKDDKWPERDSDLVPGDYLDYTDVSEGVLVEFIGIVKNPMSTGGKTLWKVKVLTSTNSGIGAPEDILYIDDDGEFHTWKEVISWKPA